MSQGEDSDAPLAADAPAPDELRDLHAQLDALSRSPARRASSVATHALRRLVGRPGEHLRGVDALRERIWRLERRLTEPAASPIAAAPRPARSPRSVGSGARRQRPSGDRPRVAVIAWSLGHNPAGRSVTLAGVLSRAFDVELVGARFPAYGRRLWAPMRGTSHRVRTYPGEAFPDHWRRLEQLAGELTADVLFVSKPRFPSYALGALARSRAQRPLVLDIDDDEPALTGLDGPIALEELPRETGAPSFLDPTGSLWTGICAGLAGAADQVTVANRELDDGHGALLVPHVRDEKLFDPTRYDPLRERARLGLAPDDRVVLFIGTPGRHKGILEVARAMSEIGDPRYKLCIIGSARDRRLRPLVKQAAGRHLHWLGNQSLAHLPASLTVADLVCVLQDPGSRVARRQTPAKVIDALAMGIPILGTATPPLGELAERGLVDLVGGAPLAERLRAVLEDRDAARQRALENRAAFLEDFSYAAVLPRLRVALHDLLDGPLRSSPALDELVSFCRASFAQPPAEA